MAVKKSKIFTIALLLGLTSALLSEVSANSLVQLDLKRISNDSVDVTLVTSEGYNDNVMVRKKSDNKYVILIPKVQSTGFSRSALNGVRDMVSDIDVKTVNDTSGGYTKVTLITTKPLDIRTKTQKSSPITAEQQEYKTLIAQANAVRNTVSEPVKQTQKTEVTVNKAPQKPEVSKPEVVNKPQSANIKLKEVDPQAVERQIRKAHLSELINEARQEKFSQQDVPQDVIAPAENASIEPGKLDDIKNAPDAVSQNKSPKSVFVKISKSVKSKFPKAGFVLIPLICLFALSKLFRIARNTVSPAFIDQLVSEPSVLKTSEYNNIVNNSELTWQEKYRLYLDKSAKPVARSNNKGNYLFIKNRVDDTEQKRIEQKRIELERLLSETEPELQIEPEIVEVYNEDDEIHKAIKFKAFDNRQPSLRATSRNKSRFKKYEVEIPLHEQKNIDLGTSALHTNPRTFKDANLKISDVDKNRIKPQDYIMSSAEEFFSILDREEAAKKQSVQKQPEPVKSKNTTTNPIAKMKKEVNNNGLIVKSGYDIDNAKGLYIVNSGGQNALVGKINDEVFVLKKFAGNVTDPIQVRHDNANVYMVKAGKFKSLVEVNDDKMGVLIEL